MKSACLLAALLVAAPLLAAAQSPATSIGVTEWTHPDATGARPAGPVRVLEQGDQVVLREEVATDDLGAADFVFANLSRLLVGPDCQVTLDRRYYDSRLDVEVKEYTLDTRFRCIAKADNFSADPADLIVINTPEGQIAVSGATATFVYAPPDARAPQGQPPRQPGPDAVPISGDADPSLLVLGQTFAPQGYVILSDLTSGALQVVIRREGFYAFIDRAGVANGPIRDATGVLSRVRRQLEGLGLPRMPEQPIPYILTEIVDPVPPGPGPGGPPEPPGNCRVSDCRPVLKRDPYYYPYYGPSLE